ncbi:MAG: Subtilase family protein [Candidatus Methanocomedens sp.]|nr:MAG: Subtilase family protein [ANME-2 cluster archaeon]
MEENEQKIKRNKYVKKIENEARILVFVQDYELNPYPKADVRIRPFETDKWQTVPYDQTIERFVSRSLEHGKFELCIRGEKGWAEDVRTIKMHSGDNSVYSTLAPKGTPFYIAAGEEKVYFQPDENKILLYAQGRNLHNILPELIKKAGLELGEPIVPPGQTVQPDNATFMISLPESAPERKKALTSLYNMVEEQFSNEGLTGRLAAPMFRGKNVIEGLTNQLVVKFESSVTEQLAQKIARGHEFTVVRRVNYLGNAYLWERGGIPHYDLLKVAQELMEKFPVLYAEPNVLLQLELDVYNPNDFLYPEQQHFQVINADDAWDTLDDIDVNLRSGSPNLTIAVFDGNGVAPNHLDLTGNLTDGTAKMIRNFDFTNWTNQTVANLTGDHGTKCASSATGRFDNNIGGTGLAGNCHLIGARLPTSVTTLNIADAWIWAAGFVTGSTNPNFPLQLATGADIISNSWGAALSGAWNNTIKDALDFLTIYGRGGKGCVVCFSVGNLGYVQFSNVRRYAAYERTIAVGASINSNPTNPCNSNSQDHNGNTNNLPAIVDTRAYYSPYGPELDIVAPSHTSYDGTGKVDPIVSAVRVNQGTWIAQAVTTTTTSAGTNSGDTVINVNNSAGFAVGEYALFGTPGGATREFVRINAIGVGQLTVDALQNGYPAGTQVSTGPNDYDRNFGGTSHSCPTVAGAAALILSVRPELTWVQVREILRTTATRIDIGQTNAIGQWVDNDGDGVNEFSQWYGYGRLDVNAAVIAARDLDAVPDVVVRDNLTDNGTVPSGGWHAHSPDIWARSGDDPIPALAYDANPPHLNPERGHDNYVYMRVKNFGGAATNEVYLRALITHFPGFEFRYPNEWQPSTRPGDPVPIPLVPGTYLIGEERIDNLAPNDDIIVKMTWDSNLIPPEDVVVGGVNVRWHPCLLAEVSPHDGPAPAGATFDVKRDNNLAHRNITIEDPDDTADDFAVGVAAGTIDAVGVDAVIIDRSLLPADYKVFIRIADERHMINWVKLLKAGKIAASEPLPGSTYEKPEPTHEWPDTKKGGCTVTLLDPARIGINCCDGNALVINAPSRTMIEMLCRVGVDTIGRPKLRMDTYQGQEVIFFEGGSHAIELPLRLASDEFVPVVLGLARPHGKRASGMLKATQRRGDGELSPGYSIEG